MNTTANQLGSVHTVKEALSGLISPYDVKPANFFQELEVPVRHGKSINYYLGIYGVIFTTIMTMVLIAEEFFF